ncbi:unnamed protein product [Cladocopium goreaui]|uniref:Uncharacterized protein n=1 Tax=Cladocopium goreaui TaxID=2562237 RepID=A0A9P1DV75_9DINO|nr:unnamed protein product [Cladocopium goreaui]
MQWKTPICLRHFEFEHITYREPGNWNPKRQPHRTGGNSPPILRLFTQAHQAPTELEVWLTAIVYIPWIFFCWRDTEQLENHYAVTFYASCGWAFMSLSSLFSVLYQEKYPDFALGILLFGNCVFALACLYFYGYHWTRMWRHFTQNRFRPLWIPGLLGLMCLHLLTPLDLMKRLDDPGWWKTVCSVYNDEWWWVADVRIIELFVTAAALLLIILHIQGVFTGMKNAAVVALAPVRVTSGRIVLAPHAPQRILDLYRSLESPRRLGNTPRRRTAHSAQKRRPSSAPAARAQRSARHEDHNGSSWSIGTLFCKERVGVGHLPRPSACTFRRPQSAGATGSMTAPPHQRPVFLVGENGVDPKDCVDIHNPRRFSSLERTFAMRGVRHLDPLVPVAPGTLPRPDSMGYSSSSSTRTISDFAPIPAFRPVS